MNKTLSGLFIAGIIIVTGCNLNTPDNSNILKGEGPIVHKVVAVDSIESVTQFGTGNIFITHGNVQKVTISAQQNILDHISYNDDNNNFFWGFDQNLTIDPSSDSINIELVLTRNISSITLGGYGNIFVESPAQKNLKMDITGAGNILGYGIPLNNCNISIYGKGSCQVNVSDTLIGIISGQGYIYYKGHPVIQIPVLGVGSVIDAN